MCDFDLANCPCRSRLYTLCCNQHNFTYPYSSSQLDTSAWLSCLKSLLRWKVSYLQYFSQFILIISIYYVDIVSRSAWSQFWSVYCIQTVHQLYSMKLLLLSLQMSMLRTSPQGWCRAFSASSMLWRVTLARKISSRWRQSLSPSAFSFVSATFWPILCEFRNALLSFFDQKWIFFKNKLLL